MKSINIFILVCVFIIVSGTQALSEEWTAEQKEVWEMVELYWEIAKQGDFKALMANYYTMESYEWGASEEKPLGINELKPHLQQWLSYAKPDSYELKPHYIYVVGNTATVYYSNKWKGENISERSRQMDTYIKQGNKWHFIGGMGCSCNDLPKCN